MPRVKMIGPLCLCLLTAAARPALAQVTDSGAFHRGEWGADFAIASGFQGGSALRFSSPTRALVLSVLTHYDHTASPDTASGASTDAVVSVQLGTRGYHRIDRHLYQWTTLGVGVSSEHQTARPDSVNTTSQSTFVSLFGELGAAWMVTSHLGLGAGWEVRVSYNHTSTDAPFGGPSHVVNYWLASLGDLHLMGQLYF